MQNAREFPDFLRLIDERSTAFSTLIAGAPDLDVPVPTCPGWTLFDLVQHLGAGRRKWAAVVAGKVPGPAAAAPSERPALLAWFTASTQELLNALREAGPDRGCRTWWGASQSPQTSGAVARHQVQEGAVHTYDAQLALGDPQPLPVEIALDGVEEFQLTCCATTAAWPHEPAVVDYHATEGLSLRLRLSADGARVTRLQSADDKPDASLRGTASDLVLVFYGRIPLDSVELAGDRRVFEQLIAWEPEA
ncbi:maleylpyruvate isomerase family mycothiol-dependent enzyme [Nucisporomicrobium flavum]|uniref:maleylpyruvate isomerase family mycothiol-dependent enzyme n=1 Tax=Nucisporomicrobium flavum TaxID=2785915 RepID=UPI0018F6F58F|nr:maleylpyruvate isomerase family mycothiol-dependent enzyme [Nucisporomicrobium flavum]